MPARLRSINSLHYAPSSRSSKKESSGGSSGGGNNKSKHKSVSSALSNLASRRRLYASSSARSNRKGGLSSRAGKALDDGDASDGDSYKREKQEQQLQRRRESAGSGANPTTAPVAAAGGGGYSGIGRNNNSSKHTNGFKKYTAQESNVTEVHSNTTSAVIRRNNDPVSSVNVSKLVGGFGSSNQRKPDLDNADVGDSSNVYFEANFPDAFDDNDEQKNEEAPAPNFAEFPEDESPPPRAQPKQLILESIAPSTISESVSHTASIDAPGEHCRGTSDYSFTIQGQLTDDTEITPIDNAKLEEEPKKETEEEEIVRAGNEALLFIYGHNVNLYTDVFHLPTDAYSSSSMSTSCSITNEDITEAYTILVDHLDMASRLLDSSSNNKNNKSKDAAAKNLKQAKELCGMNDTNAHQHIFLHPKTFIEIKRDAIKRAYDILTSSESSRSEYEEMMWKTEKDFGNEFWMEEEDEDASTTVAETEESVTTAEEEEKNESLEEENESGFVGGAMVNNNGMVRKRGDFGISDSEEHFVEGVGNQSPLSPLSPLTDLDCEEDDDIMSETNGASGEYQDLALPYQDEEEEEDGDDMRYLEGDEYYPEEHDDDENVRYGSHGDYSYDCEESGSISQDEDEDASYYEDQQQGLVQRNSHTDHGGNVHYEGVKQPHYTQDQQQQQAYYDMPRSPLEEDADGRPMSPLEYSYHSDDEDGLSSNHYEYDQDPPVQHPQEYYNDEGPEDEYDDDKDAVTMTHLVASPGSSEMHQNSTEDQNYPNQQQMDQLTSPTDHMEFDMLVQNSLSDHDYFNQLTYSSSRADTSFKSTSIDGNINNKRDNDDTFDPFSLYGQGSSGSCSRSSVHSGSFPEQPLGSGLFPEEAAFSSAHDEYYYDNIKGNRAVSLRRDSQHTTDGSVESRELRHAKSVESSSVQFVCPLPSRNSSDDDDSDEDEEDGSEEWVSEQQTSMDNGMQMNDRVTSKESDTMTSGNDLNRNTSLLDDLSMVSDDFTVQTLSTTGGSTVGSALTHEMEDDTGAEDMDSLAFSDSVVSDNNRSGGKSRRKSKGFKSRVRHMVASMSSSASVGGRSTSSSKGSIRSTSSRNSQASSVVPLDVIGLRKKKSRKSGSSMIVGDEMAGGGSTVSRRTNEVSEKAIVEDAIGLDCFESNEEADAVVAAGARKERADPDGPNMSMEDGDDDGSEMMKEINEEDIEIETFLSIASEFSAMNKAAAAAASGSNGTSSQAGRQLQSKSLNGSEDDELSSLASVSLSSHRSEEEEEYDEAKKELQQEILAAISKSRSVESFNQQQAEDAIDCFPAEVEEGRAVRFSVEEDEFEFDTSSTAGSVGRRKSRGGGGQVMIGTNDRCFVLPYFDACMDGVGAGIDDTLTSVERICGVPR